MKKWYILLAVLVILALGIVYSAFKTTIIAFDPVQKIDEPGVYKLINDKRIELGLQVLAYDKTLDTGAQMRSDELCSLPMSHDNFVPTAQKVQYYADLVGENLAKDWYTNKEMVNAWVASPTHYENIKNPAFIETGIGVADCGESIIVTQWFGTGN